MATHLVISGLATGALAQSQKQFRLELIRFNELDESFLPKLHASTHPDFIECLEEKRREDQYEAQG